MHPQCSSASAHKTLELYSIRRITTNQMTPSSLTLRLLLVRVTATGDLPVVKHSRYRHEFLKSLAKEERRLRSRKIPRASLLTLAASTWRNLLASDVNQSLITMTGFDGVSFASLLQKFAPLFDDYTPFHTSHILLKQDPSKGGRPRMVRPEDCLFTLRPPRDRRGIEE